MDLDVESVLRSGDISVHPRLGLVRNDRGESARLGPIPMKVLELLASRPGEVVSRNELFDYAWPNQTVSDDTLTRCISDIRALLSQLSRFKGHLETLPKRGYRWVPTPAHAEPPEPDVEPQTPSETSPQSISVTERQHKVGRALKSIAIYLVLGVALASAGVWMAGKLMLPPSARIAILPVEVGNPSLDALAPRLASALNSNLMAQRKLEILAPRAVSTSPANPFPYLHSEFGVRWLVEARIDQMQDQLHIGINLVDARTALVSYSFTRTVPADEADWDVISTAFVLRAMRTIRE